MDKEEIIQLTNKLYRITLFFPKKEPLRYKMRELADDFLAKPNGKDLDTLLSFFDVASAQNWVKAEDILEIKQKYDSLKGGLKDDDPPEDLIQEDSRILQPELPQIITDRKEKILQILKEKGRVQVWEVKKVLPEVSKRTLRRDFDFLLKQGTIERMGERNNTFYQIKTA
ncbi:MAG: DeoR family transcriptional regulator [Candidatus Pacebacteria bacterium]|nr:DeoR family transcriptional regulator [Candidatus Paceibacterota bacterium]